jgi:hypothetical protein
MRTTIIQSARWERSLRRGALGLALFALLVSTRPAPARAILPANAGVRVALEPRRTWDFGDVYFSNDFSSGRLADCQRLGPDRFLGVITPENQPINRSPWFAFKLWAADRRVITLVLTNTYSTLRGRPWVSHDGKKWERLPVADHATIATSPTAVVRLKIGPRPIWLATQELVGRPEIEAWADRLARRPGVTASVIGESVTGRPLRQLVIGGATNRNFVFVLGRQHPPEVTGTLALMRFVDELAGNSRLARQYRREFQTIVLPLVNPDGVEHGHWRSNLGAVDLNRDWGPFTQPESRAASAAIRAFTDLPGARPYVFVDLHSTHTNIFYAQPDSQPLFPEQFTRRWLASIAARLPEFKFERDDAHNVRQPTSKAWANEQFGIAAITWEFGYATDRAMIRRAATVAAQEFMRLLLSETARPPVAAAGR